MLKRILSFSAALIFATAFAAIASDRNDDMSRIHKSADVFDEIMKAPDGGIPAELLEKARCIAIIPGNVKFAFILGGNYGRGLATCRRDNGSWTAPLFLAVDGGSVGYQIGGSSTDLVMVFMNDHALHSLLSDEFKLGGDASVAAGPVGRTATADTDAKLTSEILSYSRAKGVFAGVSLQGAVVKADKSGDEAMYGKSATRNDIMMGQVPAPPEAEPLLHSIHNYAK